MFERLISHLIGNSKPNHSSSQSGIVAPGRGRHRGIGRMRLAFFTSRLLASPAAVTADRVERRRIRRAFPGGGTVCRLLRNGHFRQHQYHS